jgi:hypothetical protein
MYYSLLLWDQLLCSGKIGVCFIQHKLTEISYNTPSVFTCSPPTIAIRYEGICTFCSEPLCLYLLSQSQRGSEQKVQIPSYLIAIVGGDLESR